MITKKRAVLFLMLLMSPAYAQVTRTFLYSANGSEMSATVHSSSQAAWQVVNMSSVNFNTPCTPAPVLSQPRIVTSTGNSVLFKQNLKASVHPYNVWMTQLRMRICYTVVGNNMAPLEIVMQYKNLATGVKTDGPVIATIDGGNYIVPQTILSAEASLNLPVNGMMSADMQNYEFGYRIRFATPIHGTPSTIAVHKIQTKLLFNATPMEFPNAPAASFEPLITFSQSKVHVTQPYNPPTNNETLSIEIRCGNNVYRPLIVTGGGSPSSPFEAAWSMQVINTAAYCGGSGGSAPLSAGQVTMVRARNTTTNQSAYSPNFTLN